MNLTATLRAYNELADAANSELPHMYATPITISPPEHIQFGHTGGVRDMIESFHFDQGWVCFTSAVVPFIQCASLPSNGIILSAEFCKGEAESLHIRQDGRGGWFVSHLREGDNGKHAIAALANDQTFLSERRALKHLRYREYWRLDEHRGMQKFAARFIGFAKDAI